MNWRYIKKAIVCAVFMAIMIFFNRNGIQIPGLDSIVLDMLVGLLGTYGVYAATNESA